MSILDREVFLFDLDGTLVDSSGLHDRAFRTVISDVLPSALDGFAYEDIRGMTTVASFARLGVPASLIAEAAARKQREYRDLIAGGLLEELPGARSLLATLRAGSRRLAIVTSGSRVSAEAALDATGLLNMFDVAVFADDVTEGKPSPVPYRLACERLRVDATQAVVVEDAAAGVQSGRGAGCAVVGVHQPQLRTLTDAYFDSLAELEQAMR